MSDEGLTSGTRRSPRRLLGRTMTGVVSSVVLLGFGATEASARPAPAIPPTPTGTTTVSASGAVTVTATGAWSWPTGTGAGELNATALQQCAGDYGVGWGIVWNDSTDTGYPITYKKKGVPFSVNVGSKTGPDSNLVGYDTSDPCGTFSAPNKVVTGQWTATHTYAAGTPMPSQVCVVSYVLKHPPAGHTQMYQVNTNRNNSFHTAVKHGNGSIAKFETSTNCFDPASFKGSPTIVTTATNAQVGSAITDSAALTGTSQDVGAVLSNAGGTITFALYGPSDTNCTSTPVFTSSATVSGDGTYSPSSFTPTQGAGTYRWIATYGGDPSNNGATELCGASGETSTLSTGPATSASNPPTSPTSSVPVVTTSSTSGTSGTSGTRTAVTGASLVHTGEPWAGSRPYVIALVAFGISLMGLGFFERRRIAVRMHALRRATTTD